MDPPVLVAREDGWNDRKDQQAESLRALPLSTLKQVCRNGTEKELGGAQAQGSLAAARSTQIPLQRSWSWSFAHPSGQGGARLGPWGTLKLVGERKKEN